jgi:hypothetical protein
LDYPPRRGSLSCLGILRSCPLGWHRLALGGLCREQSAHACFPRSGQREKKVREHLAQTPCVPVSFTFAQERAKRLVDQLFVGMFRPVMLTRFFESGAQKTESIIAFNCSVRRSVSFRSKGSPRHSSLETGANVAARLKLRGKAELKTHRDAYDEHCIQRRHPAPTSVPCQVNCQWRYRRPVHILSYVKIMTPFDLTTARGLRPRDG